MSRHAQALSLACAFVFAALPAAAQPGQPPAAGPTAPATGGTPETPETRGTPETPETPEIIALEIRSPTPLGKKIDITSVLEIEPGKPLTDMVVRHTLRNLVATGVASQAELYTRTEPEGVVAVLVLRPVVQVNKVRVAGDLGLDESELRAVLPQKEAQPLAEEAVVQGVYNLQDFYKQNGFFKASVHLDVRTDPVLLLADVTFQVAAGPRATVGTIGFDGPVAPLTPAVLIEHLRSKPGKPYRQRAAEDDAERLQAWLIEQHYGAARVDRPRSTYDAASNTMALVYPLQLGPLITLRITGGDEKKLAKKGLLPFLGPEGYDEALVQQALAKLKAYYQLQGHYHVRVDSAEKRADGKLELAITIDPGPVYTLEAVEFRGNRGVGSSQLAKLMTTARRSLLRPGSGRLVQDELDADLENIRSYYALQGYGQAKVGPAQVTEQGAALRLAVPIEEGPQQRVVRLELRGVEKLDAAKLRKNLPLQEGGPYHPVLLEQTLTAIRTTYADQGYLRVQVSSAADWERLHLLVDLTLSVLEGPQRVLDRVVVRGNRATSSNVIRRALAIKHGEPLGQTTLFDLESRLYRLGIFSRADVELTGSGLDSPERDLLARVEEGKFKTLTYGAGYDTQEGLRGTVGFSHSNVAGQADSLRADLRLSQRDKRFRLLFNQPYLGSHRIPLTSTLFYFDTREVSFRTRRWGGRVEAVKASPHKRLSLAFDYRVVDLKVDPGVALNAIERQNRPYQLSSVIPTQLLDHRDDPLEPTRGWSSLAQIQYSFPLASKAEFVKLFLQQTQYFHLGRPGVVAASVRAGGIEAFSSLGRGDPEVPPSLPSSNVFIDERFFGGGSTTHRAYSLDRLGIRGQTLIQPAGRTDFKPVGGNGLLLANVDYRFPIAGPVGGTLFFDSGNVWADWRDIRLQDVKSGVGVGVRYLSPIGPLRAEIGWKLKRERHPDEPPFVVFLSFGNPF